MKVEAEQPLLPSEPKLSCPADTTLERMRNDRSSRSARVLLIDADASTRQMLANRLTEHNMNVATASRRDEVIRHFSIGEPNIVLLDIYLGQENGLDLLREIRSRSEIPIIITAGHLRDEIDRIVGLELGADDFVTKPFGIHELVARMRAVLRRHESARRRPRRDVERRCYRFGGWQLNCQTRRLTDPNGVPVALTKGEYALLIAFLESPRRPLTRQNLLQATRTHDDVFERSIDVQVLRLRRKLETEPSTPRMVKTKRDIGYTFTLQVELL
jgi:two-component system, OmpR family, response regulator